MNIIIVQVAFISKLTFSSESIIEIVIILIIVNTPNKGNK